MRYIGRAPAPVIDLHTRRRLNDGPHPSSTYATVTDLNSRRPAGSDWTPLRNDHRPQYRRAPLLTHAWRCALSVPHRAPRHGR